MKNQTSFISCFQKKIIDLPYNLSKAYIHRKPLLPAVLDDEVYETELNNYLNDGINYGANTIKNADIGDLQQLAADSFFYGYLLAVKRFKNGR